MKADAVFEGGGVKAIGLVGALVAAEELGYQWVRVAGTSAGAMVASLVAAGYKATEIKKLMNELDYAKMKDQDSIDKVPLVGPFLSIGFEMGLFEGKYLEKWIREKLAAKGVKTFGDLLTGQNVKEARFNYKLQIIAVDISRGQLLVLPQDISDYGIKPESMEVARAVRMSCSIPFFFEPVVQTYWQKGVEQTSYIVDGALLSNFPVWLFDVKKKPRWPTFGFKLVGPNEGKPHNITGPISYLEAILSTMINGHDNRHIQDSSFVRTVTIPTFGIGATDFELSNTEKRRLYHGGWEASRRFFTQWDFGTYVDKYR